MKVAFVTLGFRPFRFSGLDVSGERLVDGLVRLGHDVCVIAGYKGRSVTEDFEAKPRVYRLPVGKSDWIGYSLRASLLLRHLARRESFDVVHFWDIHFAFAFFGKFAGSLHHSFRQRIESINANYYRRLSRAKYYAYYFVARMLAEYPSLRRARVLLAVSETTKKEFELHYKLPSSKVYLARHGIETHFFRNRPKEALLLREQLGIGRADPVLLFTGFITPRKNIEMLLEAVTLMEDKPIILIAGQWRDQRYRTKVLGSLGEGQRIIEVGFVKDEFLPIYYSMADVYVSPSLLEGFGLSLVESLACETPVVAFKVGAVPEVVGPGGFLAEPSDPFGMASCISRLLQDSDLKRQMGKAGRSYVEENFSMDKFISSTLDGYKVVLEGS